MTHKEMADRLAEVIKKEIELQKTDDWKKIIPPLFADLCVAIGAYLDSELGEKEND